MSVDRLTTVRTRLLGMRRFSVADQEHFAILSGDFNPLHVDPAAARRAIFGEPVVHGIHVVAWALELYLADLQRRGLTAFSLRRLSARFPKPLFLREKVEARLLEDAQQSSQIQVTNGETTFVDAKLLGERGVSTRFSPVRTPGDYSKPPKMRSIQELSGLSGTMELCYDAELLAHDFPASCALLGPGTLARVLSLSRLVGMECPGLHSLFSAFNVEFLPDDARALSFVVERFDPRFSMVRMRVAEGGLAGTVDAFLRPPPTEQVRAELVAAMVSPDDFAGQRALVVGGSRGLGEVMAKIVAGGGGHSVITYRHGEDDASAVVDEIRQRRGRCDMIRLDVAAPHKPLLQFAKNGWSPTHLYYFATPRIFARKTGLFDDRLFRQFLAVYVGGFFRVYKACRHITVGPLDVFYPSSVAVDENVKELTEYAAAKVAGETLCRHVERFDPQVRILVERLPRMRTDQTATLLPVPAADASKVLCEIARKLAQG